MTTPTTIHHFIGGKPYPSQTAEWRDVTNPATQEVVADDDTEEASTPQFSLEKGLDDLRKGVEGLFAGNKKESASSESKKDSEDADKSETADKSDKSDKSDTSDKAQKTDKADKADKAEKSDKSDSGSSASD